MGYIRNPPTNRKRPKASPILNPARTLRLSGWADEKLIKDANAFCDKVCKSVYNDSNRTLEDEIVYTYIEGAKSREDHIKKLEDTLVKAINMLEHSDELWGYQLVDLKKEAEGLGIDPHRLWTFIEKK
jgi:hypothetical protein